MCIHRRNFSRNGRKWNPTRYNNSSCYNNNSSCYNNNSSRYNNNSSRYNNNSSPHKYKKVKQEQFGDRLTVDG